jgi:hypothetical protein
MTSVPSNGLDVSCHPNCNAHLIADRAIKLLVVVVDIVSHPLVAFFQPLDKAVDDRFAQDRDSTAKLGLVVVATLSEVRTKRLIVDEKVTLAALVSGLAPQKPLPVSIRTVRMAYGVVGGLAQAGKHD